MIPPCEMIVGGYNTITIKTNSGTIVSTGDKADAYKVTHDAVCKFLISDITEEELLAEAVKLAEETSELERLRGLVSHYQEMDKASSVDLSVLKEKLDAAEATLEYIFQIAHDSWSPFYSRISLIRKLVSVGLSGEETKK